MREAARSVGAGANDHQGRLGRFATIGHEMRPEDLGVMRPLPVMMRGQRDRERRDAGIEPGAHQAVDHGLRDELIAIDPAVHNQGREWAELLARSCRHPVQGRHFDCHWNGERIDLYREAGAGRVFRIG